MKEQHRKMTMATSEKKSEVVQDEVSEKVAASSVSVFSVQGAREAAVSKIKSVRQLGGLRFKKESGYYFFTRNLEAEQGTIASGGAGRLLIRSFLVAVIFPSVLALFYYAVIASDVYVAETKLTVRTAPDSEGKSSGLSDVAGSFVSKLGFSKGGSTAQDSRIILDYIKSRSAIEDVGGRDVLKSLYDRNDIDWLSRLDANDYMEDLWDYWKRRVTASIDTISNILTVRVRAYSPEDALTLAQKLVLSSEKLINEISRRSREDALQRAQDEVDRSMTELADVRLQMLSFQQSSQSIDPIETAKQIAALISNLTLQKIELESRLAVADTMGVKGRPGDRYLNVQLDVLNVQLVKLENMLTGKDQSSVSLQLKDFELLKLRQEFAEQIYTLARASYEEARRNVSKQQLYLVVVVPPFKPEDALYPRAFTDAGIVFLACLVLWAIVTLLVASLKDSTEL